RRSRGPRPPAPPRRRRWRSSRWARTRGSGGRRSPPGRRPTRTGGSRSSRPDRDRSGGAGPRRRSGSPRAQGASPTACTFPSAAQEPGDEISSRPQARRRVRRWAAAPGGDERVVSVNAPSPTDWFASARFGMFVHWGHHSTRGGDLSLPLVGGAGDLLPHSHPLSAAEYHAGAPGLSPHPGAARRWMALARRAGMRYAVLTAKHHDGFALWPTEHTDWSISRTRYEGDLVAEFVEAARAEGLRVGLYFSLCDWHHPD